MAFNYRHILKTCSSLECSGLATAQTFARSLSTTRPHAGLVLDGGRWGAHYPASTTPPTPFANQASQRRTMFIQTETTPNDSSLKFIPGVPVMVNGGTYEILDAKASLVSPLAVRLMGIDGVTSVFYGPDFVTVSKDDSQPWSTLKPEVFSILMEHFTSDKNLFKDSSQEMDGPQDTKILDTDSEVVAMIKELLDTRVRPAIQEDGGDIEFRGFGEDTDGLVRLKLKGSCRGCASSSVTLKSGIERMLTHYIPEVKGVEQVLDEEEVIALDEFKKLEKRLEEKKGKENKDE